MRTSAIVRAVIHLDAGLSVLRINYPLKIKYLAKEIPRDGYKNKGKL